MQMNFSNDDFKFLKKLPPLGHIIISIVLLLGGIAIQIFLPFKGIFPFENPRITYLSFIVGLVLLVIALLLIFPERMKISEEPKLLEDEGYWTETTMKQLSDIFNTVNKRKKKETKLASFFDLTTSRGKWTFTLTITLTLIAYPLLLLAANRLTWGNFVFIIDIYLFVTPLWFILRIKKWEPEILRKILFYHQFSQHANINEIEYTATPAVQLKEAQLGVGETVLLPTNVRFMIDFENRPESFDSLSIQIILNEQMNNVFPFLVCFLRMRKPDDWMPLEKDEAYADRIVKIAHQVEDEGLHLFVLSKSPKVDISYHTSPFDATKIFKRAHKMMIDFDKE
ncbi:MAG: hypothetical protein ACTSO7_13285 [Candidatus Heimdallarchaeota archaeon]